MGNDGAVGSLSFIRVQSGEQLDVDVGEQGHGVDVGCGLWPVGCVFMGWSFASSHDHAFASVYRTVTEICLIMFNTSAMSCELPC